MTPEEIEKLINRIWDDKTPLGYSPDLNRPFFREIPTGQTSACPRTWVTECQGKTHVFPHGSRRCKCGAIDETL